MLYSLLKDQEQICHNHHKNLKKNHRKKRYTHQSHGFTRSNYSLSQSKESENPIIQTKSLSIIRKLAKLRCPKIVNIAKENNRSKGLRETKHDKGFTYRVKEAVCCRGRVRKDSDAYMKDEV